MNRASPELLSKARSCDPRHEPTSLLSFLRNILQLGPHAGSHQLVHYLPPLPTSYGAIAICGHTTDKPYPPLEPGQSRARNFSSRHVDSLTGHRAPDIQALLPIHDPARWVLIPGVYPYTVGSPPRNSHHFRAWIITGHPPSCRRPSTDQTNRQSPDTFSHALPASCEQS